MRAWLLAAMLASPAGAAIVEVAPPVWSASPVPSLRTAALPLPALADPARALLPSLTPAALLPVLPAPAIPVDRKAAVPVPLAADPAAARAELGTDARAEARELVASLLARQGNGSEELDSAFDGTDLHSAGLPGALEVGAALETRQGGYTLASARSESRGGLVTRYERWTGKDGSTLWVRRRLGPDRWELAEWGGRHAPKGFAPDGLPLPPSFYADFELNGGRLTSNIETKHESGKRSALVDAKRSFQAALEWFGPAVTGVKGGWVYGDNLAEFNRLTASGLTPEEAALETWTGKRAAAAGFVKVVLSEQIRAQLAGEKPGEHESMAALFVRP